MSFRFKKSERLKKGSEIKSVTLKGYRIRGKIYNCYYIENSHDKIRFGIIVSRKNGNAVKRNYEKRVLREFIRIHKDKINRKYDIVFILKSNDFSLRKKKTDFLNILNAIECNEQK